ncbi:hypothetical protein T492DRAFT_1068145 [Pavlovales sp. CCMP2436]|nr:hypothetical protein T492DRAFT_1068145 [Pavlovales sp. CCMP2436]|mmetsp:Transcript_4993/g.12925  ORF Transcript_4993/g.12925 Transcript_4993/m.12925 type:complete len:365 (-) Transcript_4993:418-1512(-)
MGDSRTPCRFFQVGRCTAGSNCRFSHELVKAGETLRFTTPCKFFREGRCANGDCPFLHEPAAGRPVQQPRPAPGPSLVPRPGNGYTIAPSPQARADAFAASAAEEAASAEATCAVCLERVLARGRLFGLLPECTHCVCLPCIREWRSSETVDSSAARGCPVCRVVSPYVVPSKLFVEKGARKEQIRGAYLSALSGKPCKHFDRGRGTCPFGSSCFYSHSDANGRTVEPAAPRVAYSTSGARTAGGWGGSAATDVAMARIESLTLSDYFATGTTAPGAGGSRPYVDPLADEGFETGDALLASIRTVDRRTQQSLPPQPTGPQRPQQQQSAASLFARFATAKPAMPLAAAAPPPRSAPAVEAQDAD